MLIPPCVVSPSEPCCCTWNSVAIQSHSRVATNLSALEAFSALRVGAFPSAMGCCCSQEDQRRKCGTIPTHRTEADSGGELLTRSEDLPAIATSFESHSRQEVRAFKEPRSVPEPQRSQRSVPSIDVDPLQRNPRRTPSQRTAEIQSNHNPKRSPSPMTPNTLNKESVKIELDELLDLGKTFVQQCFSHSSKSQSSKARKTIYQSVIENVVGKDNPKSRK